MGLYGMTRIGKTLLCKGMCHELDGEFDGKVCYLRLDNQNERYLFNEVLTTLTTMPMMPREIGKKEGPVLFTHNDILDDLDFKPFDS